MEDGDIIWNTDDKFKGDSPKSHLNLVIDDKGYTMTSSAPRNVEDRIQYKQEDVEEGFTVVGNKFVTNNTNELKRKYYTKKGNFKKSFIDKFKEWLNKSK